MANSPYKIVDDVPLPTRITLPPLPLEDMSIGDSFVVRKKKPSDHEAIRQRLMRYQRRNPPARFSLRTEEGDNVRIFRVEDYE